MAENGACASNFPSGALKSEAVYQNDVLQGEGRFYFPDGKVRSSGIYRNGLKDGVWVNYMQNGNKESEIEYLHGEVVAETYYDKVLEKEMKEDVPELK
jgi:antitoxin component YwqK of YwqJK toxin-antitoxin module